MDFISVVEKKAKCKPEQEEISRLIGRSQLSQASHAHVASPAWSVTKS